MIVVDNSVLIPEFLDTPESRAARLALAKYPGWIVPPLWRFEFVNVVVTLLRAGNVNYPMASDALDRAVMTLTGIEQPVDQLEVVRNAIRYGISAYDSQYITLARSRGCQCLTADKRLARRVPQFTVPLT